MIFGYSLRGTATGTGDLLFSQSPLHAVLNAALDTWMVVCSAALESTFSLLLPIGWGDLRMSFWCQHLNSGIQQPEWLPLNMRPTSKR